MTIRSLPPHVILFTSLLAAAGCGPIAAGADLSAIDHAAEWGADAGARPERAEGVYLAPAAPLGTQDIEPGALLDVWLNDDDVDLATLTSGPSLGSAVARGDFFRYTSVNADPDLRGLWGQPLALKWSALLEITEQGAYVFRSELSKERGFGAMEVRTLVRLNGETLFEKEVRVFGGNQITESGSRALNLDPGFYRLEVLLSVENRLALPPSTRIGTYITMREPGVMTAAPLPLSRLWHRVGG